MALQVVLDVTEMLPVPPLPGTLALVGVRFKYVAPPAVISIALTMALEALAVRVTVIEPFAARVTGKVRSTGLSGPPAAAYTSKLLCTSAPLMVISNRRCPVISVEISAKRSRTL